MNSTKGVPEPPQRPGSGALLIAGILVVALVAAVASWWYRWESTREAARFWGPDAASLIRDAPRVALLELQPTADENEDTVAIGNSRWAIADRHDISRAPGLTHLRYALLQDHSFIWPEQPPSAEADWRWGLRFAADDSPRHFTVWFTSDARIALKDQPGDPPPHAVSCEPIAAGLLTIFAEMSREAPPAR